jgi:hypothetical protein
LILRDTIEFLKAALNRQPNSGPFGCYHIRDGVMFAQNSEMMAVAPLENSDEFSVPGEELEAAFSRMHAEPRLTLTGNDLTIQSGRLRSVIPTTQGHMPSLYDNDGLEWSPTPPALVAALKAALPFLLGNATGWTAGIRLMDGRVTCLNNRCGIDIAVSEWSSPPSLITKGCAEFIVAQAPDEYSHKQGALTFRWSDGRVVQMQLLDQIMPDAVDNIFAKGGTDYPVEITPEWRQAFDDVSAVADNVIEISPDFIRVGRGSSKITMEIETPVPKDHRSFWETKVLAPMMEVATHWNPAAWPSVAAFTGPSLYGVVAGIKQ